MSRDPADIQSIDMFNLEQASARIGDPATSKEAALHAQHTLAAPMARLVVDYLSKYGPLTTREIAHLSKCELGSITPRMVVLEKAGLIERTSARRVCRFTDVGRSGIVWMTTSKRSGTQ